MDMDDSDNRVDKPRSGTFININFCATCKMKGEPCYYKWGCKNCLVCKVQKIRCLKGKR